MQYCNFIKPDGTTCKALATKAGDGDKCFTHNPAYAEAKAAAVKKGGEHTTPAFRKYGEEREIETPDDIKHLLADTINGLWTGNLNSNSKIASSIGYLADKWIQAHQASDMSEKLDAIEARLIADDAKRSQSLSSRPNTYGNKYPDQN